MNKSADMYLMVNPWNLEEDGFHVEQSQVSESLFSLANETMGVRGYFEEGYSGKRLLGSYFNGLYDYSQEPPINTYKGVVTEQHFMVNAADWLATEIVADGEKLDLATVKFSDFNRVLDFKKGTLTRKFIWTLQNGKQLAISFMRFVDMTDTELAFQQIKFTALTDPIAIRVKAGINFNTRHGSGQYQYWHELAQDAKTTQNFVIGETVTAKKQLASGFRLFVQGGATIHRSQETRQKYSGQIVEFICQTEQSVTLTKDIVNIVYRKQQETAIAVQAITKQLTEIDETLFATRKAVQADYWADVWKQVDIKIDGDEKNQQGIRFCIFQLEQTYHGNNPQDNIGAKGLTGEAYNGHAFWDTETSCLPFYLFNNQLAAKRLLEYRYATLPQAKHRAKELDCLGACYPIATLNGDEASNLWQHASTQFQPSTGVAYAIWHYVHLTNDTKFLQDKGLEMLIEISRFLYSRGDWGQESHKFGFYGVMGPDEFQVMVNHNMYTNIMAQETFKYTLKAIQTFQQEQPEILANLLVKTKLNDQEMENWHNAEENMLVLQRDNGLIEQHQGYFDLPHIDITKIPNSDFPLYEHWSYDHLFRNDMIKQADVLMLLFLHNSNYSEQVKEINYDYYEPRTIHESSLSPAIHSIIAAELHKYDEAMNFFEYATRLDLDNYNRNTKDGLHTTSLACAWLNIVYGFGGLRSDAKYLLLKPTLPKKWNSYEFHLNYQGSVLTLKVMADAVQISGTRPVTVKLYDRLIDVDQNIHEYPIPNDYIE
ncbi:glycoside hydrolase family 65 protein [Lapidilactobacillus dextrinicus]|uniref:glycoside hydrolase family 65 protein n=1 Tax=Lapidilactobacillus dextrinicus TaxID=51664 RepID=UPI0022E15DCD|nr:glycosyl hydrolase family 65 protein [Lapidilactobacillus dextrinicus]